METTMKWFGEDWGAPICKEVEQVPMREVIGRRCMACDLEIHAGDRGLLIPHLLSLSEHPPVRMEPWHLHCFVRDVVSSGVQQTR